MEMNIFINGKKKTVAESLTAQQLLEDLGLITQKFALEINEEVVPRSIYRQHTLQANDRVEIIHAIGGG